MKRLWTPCTDCPLSLCFGWQRNLVNVTNYGQALSAQDWRKLTGCLFLIFAHVEGRLDEKGHLQCAYHGWSFDGSGRATHIPQLEPKAEATACASRRSCAVSLPVQVSALLSSLDRLQQQ